MSEVPCGDSDACPQCPAVTGDLRPSVAGRRQLPGGLQPRPRPSPSAPVAEREIKKRNEFGESGMEIQEKRKRSRGGPLPLPAGELRSMEIKVRYTAAEHAQANASARNAGMKLAVFARELTLKNKIIKSAPSPEYFAHYQQLSRTNSNLNQLAHAVNVQLLHGAGLDTIITNRLKDLQVLLVMLGDDVDRLRAVLINRD